ncbi:transposase [Chitinophaga oryziterrae]|uniref:Transposase n=1 Tax=Chitinophaga oryziterrae TaxID=1031224 RepID=A0A6N8JGD0_9BACT|nr:transposase [Chitinophaga oryziterrae]MVT43202.1 transposase [Chitinophaga oryziterrae]
MTAKKTKRTRRKYDAGFKEEVLKMLASGRPVAEISESLGIGVNLVYRWKNDNTPETDTTSSDGSPSTQSALLIDNERLKAELRRTEQERDILKKALGIFSRGN